jgi:hypothetical protein
MIRFSIIDSLNEQEGYYFLRTVLHPHATVPRWSMTAARNAVFNLVTGTFWRRARTTSAPRSS